MHRRPREIILNLGRVEILQTQGMAVAGSVRQIDAATRTRSDHSLPPGENRQPRNSSSDEPEADQSGELIDA
jgi:hypothetical protein